MRSQKNMFENALITRAGIQKETDLGLLAETLFFYRSVHIVLNQASLGALAQQLSADDFIALLNRTELKLSYVKPNFGVVSAGMPRSHQFVAIHLVKSPNKKASNYKDEIELILERTKGKSAETRKLAKAIINRVALHRFKETPLKETIITDLSQKDASDKDFIRTATLSILKHLVPTYVPPPDFRFEMFDTGQGYAVDTNLNYDALNKIYRRTTPPTHSSLSSEFILRHIIDARSDSYFASNYMAEIVTAPIYSDIIRLKHFDFLRRREINSKEIEIFHEHILSDMPSLRESVNDRTVNISDLLRLLDQADRFRNWLHSTNTDVGLVSRYVKDATAKTWADKIPTKSIRFVLAAGLGIAADIALPTGLGTAAGVSIGALDTFYLDKLMKGWRPNQFIEGPYRAMLSGGTEANHQQ